MWNNNFQKKFKKSKFTKIKIIILNKREYYEVAFTFLYLISIVSIGYFFLTKNKINKSKSQNLKLALSILLIGICIPRLEIYELIIFVAPIIFLLENFYNYRQDKNIYKIKFPTTTSF